MPAPPGDGFKIETTAMRAAASQLRNLAPAVRGDVLQVRAAASVDSGNAAVNAQIQRLVAGELAKGVEGFANALEGAGGALDQSATNYKGTDDGVADSFTTPIYGP